MGTYVGHGKQQGQGVITHEMGPGCRFPQEADLADGGSGGPSHDDGRGVLLHLLVLVLFLCELGLLAVRGAVFDDLFHQCGSQPSVLLQCVDVVLGKRLCGPVVDDASIVLLHLGHRQIHQLALPTRACTSERQLQSAATRLEPRAEACADDALGRHPRTAHFELGARARHQQGTLLVVSVIHHHGVSFTHVLFRHRHVEDVARATTGWCAMDKCGDVLGYGQAPDVVQAPGKQDARNHSDGGWMVG
eukprot:scaffold461_cov321-Pavlova_lutheri.AAC.41